MKKATAFIDGSGNSERVQASAAILLLDGERYTRTRLLPPNTTNNVGEYGGLLLALELAADLQVDELEIYSDSKLIVYQVRGEWKCQNPHLIPLRDQARKDAQAFSKVSISWIPREENGEADELCRKAIKAYRLSPDNNNPFMQMH